MANIDVVVGIVATKQTIYSVEELGAVIDHICREVQEANSFEGSEQKERRC